MRRISLVIQRHDSRMPKNAQVKERPQLYFRLYPKPDENDMPKGLKQHIASVNNIKIKQEKATLASSAKSKYFTDIAQRMFMLIRPYPRKSSENFNAS